MNSKYTFFDVFLLNLDLLQLFLFLYICLKKIQFVLKIFIYSYNLLRKYITYKLYTNMEENYLPKQIFIL